MQAQRQAVLEGSESHIVAALALEMMLIRRQQSRRLLAVVRLETQKPWGTRVDKTKVSAFAAPI